jgi:hypothetical protein
MPLNGMSVGSDFNFGFYDANSGSLINMGDVQNVVITKQKHDIATRPYNAVPRFSYVPDGYHITFTVTRSVSTLEDFQITIDQKFNNGDVVQPGYLNETIQNADGTISRYQYTNFCFVLTDHGDVSREKVVTIKGEGKASDKIPLA